MIEYVNRNTIILKPNPPRKKLNAREQAIKSAVGDAIEKTIHRGLFVHRETRKSQEYKAAYQDYLLHGTPMPYVSASFYTKVLRRV